MDGDDLAAKQLAAPVNPKDYTGLVVSGILDQQGVLDLEGKPAMDYTDMEPWQQLMLTLFWCAKDMNMPELNRQVQPVLGGVLAGAGAQSMIMTSAILISNLTAPAAAAAAATGVGAPVAAGIQIVAALIGGFVGWQQYRAAITGEENGVSKVTNAIFGWLGEQSERVVGTATYMKEINDVVNAKASGNRGKSVRSLTSTALQRGLLGVRLGTLGQTPDCTMSQVAVRVLATGSQTPFLLPHMPSTLNGAPV